MGLFWDFFEHSKEKEIKENTDSPGYHSEGVENSLSFGGLRILYLEHFSVLVLEESF